MNETAADNENREHGPLPTLWQENHGNLLLGFVAIIVVVGASIMAYRQSRFVPVRFPDSDAIEKPALVSESSDEESDNAPSVSILVSGSGSDAGTMMLAVYDSEKSFNQPDDAAILQPVEIVEGVARWTVPVERLPAKFAVAAYHDENDDRELNRNRLGIPSERYGFSRNARGLTGPPNFVQAVIERPEAGQEIEIFIR